MMIALLSVFVVWCLFVGTWAAPWLFLISMATGVLLFCFGRHSHGGMLTIDILARHSRFCGMNAGLKLWSCTALLVLCILAKTPWIPGLLLLLMAVLTTIGGISFHDYLSMFALPAVFLLLSSIALLWDYASTAVDVIRVPFCGSYLVLRAEAQVQTRLVLARALGAVSCLYFLNLSTPMPELLSALRRVHVPIVVIDLAVLIYRYIFLVLSTYHRMKDAAASRLGYGTPRHSLRTTGRVYGNLLACSFRRAGACFDAMESRCYDGDIQFLEREKPVEFFHVLLFAAILLAMTVSVIMTWQ